MQTLYLHVGVLLHTSRMPPRTLKYVNNIIIFIKVVLSHSSSTTMAPLSANTDNTHHSDETFHPDVPVPDSWKAPNTPTVAIAANQEKFTDDLEYAMIDMWEGEPGFYDYTHELYHKRGKK